MFLLIAFNNRDDLKPLHIWLVPADAINHIQNTGISESTLLKWDKYKLDINKVAACCDRMKRLDECERRYPRIGSGEVPRAIV